MGCARSTPRSNKPDAANKDALKQEMGEKKQKGTMNLGDLVPNFEADSTKGKIKLHEYFGNGWGILFSHPADFTPVCSTELNLAAKYLPEFTKRNVKIAAISCDPVESHNAWVEDVIAVDSSVEKLEYPIIADPTREIAMTLGMLDAVQKDAEGLPATARAVFIFGPEKSLKLSMLYPATTGRNFDEIIRVIDSLQLTAYQKLATPVDWKEGEECVITPAVSADDAEKLFPGYRTVDLPSKKPYLRMTKPRDEAPPKPEGDVTPAGKVLGESGGLNLGDELPNFEVDSTKGKFNLHAYTEDKWFILFSHPKDFTPVCSTELARAAKLAPEFEKRNFKMAALSSDSVESHNQWIPDVCAYGEIEGNELPYPIIADPTRDIAYRMGMLDAVDKDKDGMPVTARAVFIFSPQKKLMLSILYPATTGRNFDEIIRAIDSLQLTSEKRLATPGNWVSGSECIVVPALSQDDATKMFPLGVRVVDLPSKKPYLRYTPDPRE